MRVALDTNVLATAEGINGAERRDAALALIRRLPQEAAVVPVVETSPEAMLAAADLATDHQLGIWDAVILSAAAQSGCRLLLSDDLQEGFTWAGVTVVNPFDSPQPSAVPGPCSTCRAALAPEIGTGLPAATVISGILPRMARHMRLRKS